MRCGGQVRDALRPLPVQSEQDRDLAKGHVPGTHGLGHVGKDSGRRQGMQPI